MSIQSVNPATGNVIRQYEELSASNIDRILIKAGETFETWRRHPFSERAKLFETAAKRIRQKSDVYVRLMAEEMGKPVTQGAKEIEKCAALCEYYVQNAEKFLAPEMVPTEASKSYVAFEPLGLVLAVMPWNFPFWQVFRAAVPALLAGNVMVLKHASNVPGCAEAIGDIFRDSGFNDGVFTNVHAPTSAVDAMIGHAAVKAVTLTGSVSAGRAVAAKAGSVLKKAVLELGGSDPYVVLEDADLDLAVECCGSSRLINSGQSCIAAKRFIVVEKIYGKFLKGLVDFMAAQKMGNPFEADVTVGPLARHDLRAGIHRQVEESIQRGAELLCGGNIPSGPGAFYPPTVLGHVKKGMPVYDEEVFGPVAAVIQVQDEVEAVKVANDSVFGLGAAVFTRDAVRGERIARDELRAGSAFVNALVKSDERLPFGGLEQSGYGRELGIYGIREFANLKTIYIQ